MTAKTTSLGFDDYGDTVRNASRLQSLLTAGPMDGWSHSWHQVGRISLQFANVKGAKILHGMSRIDTIAFIVQTTDHDNGIFFHGAEVMPNDMAVLACDAHFTMVTGVPLGWMGIAVPIAWFDEFA